MPKHPSIAPFVVAMAAVVVISNVLVQFPLAVKLGTADLADLFTWGAFSYPLAFLITDLTNRTFGPRRARTVVFIGFTFAVVFSVLAPKVLFALGLFPFELSTSRLARIAVASGGAFLTAQLLDVVVFDQLRAGRWWRAPLVSSVIGSVVDTTLFFSLAFDPALVALGENDAFAIEHAPLMAVFAVEAPRYMSWAVGDLGVKLAVALAMLVPYGLLIRFMVPVERRATGS